MGMTNATNGTLYVGFGAVYTALVFLNSDLRPTTPLGRGKVEPKSEAAIRKVKPKSEAEK